MAPNRKIQQTRNNTQASTSNRRPRGSRSTNAQQKKVYHGCGICRANHSIIVCKKFANYNLQQKYKAVERHHYCSNCLARNHLLDECKNESRCRVCREKHHTVLHAHKKILQDFQRTKQPQKSKNPTRPAAKTSPSTSATSTSLNRTANPPSTMNRVFVPTAEVHTMTDEGAVTVRAIVNPSTSTSRISKTFVEDYKLKMFEVDNVPYIKLILTPNMTSLKKYELYMMVSKELPRRPYTRPFNASIKDKFDNLALADPQFYSNEIFEMELGGDIYSSILKSNIIRIDGGSLIAQDSTLGWLIMGSYSC